MPNLSGQSIGRYHLLVQLGEGGMATVYKAYDTLLEREIAVKIIRQDAFPASAFSEIAKRFEREAKALAKFSHPNIVKIHDYGDHNGSPYLVMEYLPGGTLKKMLGKPLLWQAALRLILPVARGLAYAHQRGILHRDIKPANILITEIGEPMLSDFGIAKIFERDQATALTRSGMAIGTPEYMAPEQWIGDTNPKSDLYSLGIVLYEMVTGRKPYIADTPAAILLKQANEPLPNPRQFNPNLPENVEFLLIKALAKNPAERYASVETFVTAMEGLLSNNRDEIVILAPGMFEPVPTEQTTPLPVNLPTDLASSHSATHENTIKVQDVLVSFTQRLVEKSRTRSQNWLFGSMGVAAIILLVIFVSSSWGKWFLANAVPVATEPVIHTAIAPASTITSILPTLTPILTLTPTNSFTPTPTPWPVQITDANGVIMRLVPVGEFIMGTNNNVDMGPEHTISLGNFYIDKFEITNGLYAACVAAGSCKPPKQINLDFISYEYIERGTQITSGTREFKQTTIIRDYYSKYLDYPVVYVDWKMANTYCQWRGMRLPTEAEWEKASRGTTGLMYSWGNQRDCHKGNFGDAFVRNYIEGSLLKCLYKHCLGVPYSKLEVALQEPKCDGYKGTSPVNHQFENASEYGIYDLSSNVAEWTSSLYVPYPYSISDGREEISDTGDRVFRGGSFLVGSDSNSILSFWRQKAPPSYSNSAIGFRCAQSVP